MIKPLQLIRIFVILSILIVPIPKVEAQSSAELPVYIVQTGDTINTIALRFGISPQDLIAANQISNPDLIPVGTPIKIPGYEGITGTLRLTAAPLGANLRTVSRQYKVEEEVIIRLNQLTSPSQIYVGSTLILPEQGQPSELRPLSTLGEGKTPLETAARFLSNPWKLLIYNQKETTARFLSHEVIFSDLPGENGGLFGSPLIKNIEITPLPLRQGKTQIVRVYTTRPLILSGSLNNVALSFFQEEENQYVAIQGIHAMAKPGLASLSLKAQDDDQSVLEFEQPILLEPGYYPQDVPLTVDPSTLDPEITQPEDELIRTITKSATPQRYWNDKFRVPVDEPCIRSWFGSRRSYNNSGYIYFHTGVDYGVCANNLNIYAPAPGRVVYVGELTVRGISTIIDHGWGVYSGFWHQNATKVNVGDFVETGQLIGEIGGTGRATGPHLHWEVWANGVQVEPLDWLEKDYP
ncbi:MAG: hypothetical protein KatS3mg047_0782 [Bellilinea sp.]|nr:MAG: hypothetical protein KatS3mg047_0782 [Bellilinea sp.]